MALVLLCMLTIFMFSADTDTQSTKKSNSIIIHFTEKIIGRNLTKKEKKNYVNKYDFWVRKSAHLTIYIILGLLVISYLSEYNLTDRKMIILSIIITGLYSVSDELHQTFVSGRSCELRDILIDTTGGIIGTYIYYFYYRIRRKLHE